MNEFTDMSVFAERLKELRLEKNLSLEKLAKEIKIGSSSLSRLEIVRQILREAS